MEINRAIQETIMLRYPQICCDFTLHMRSEIENFNIFFTGHAIIHFFGTLTIIPKIYHLLQLKVKKKKMQCK